MCLFKQFEHFGEMGKQRCWPNPTNSQFISLQRSLGEGMSVGGGVVKGVVKGRGGERAREEIGRGLE